MSRNTKVKSAYINTWVAGYRDTQRWPDVEFEVLADGNVQINSSAGSIYVNAETEMIMEAANLFQRADDLRRSKVVEAEVLLRTSGILIDMGAEQEQ